MSSHANHCSKEVSSEYISAASHFALKLAFQTLKERFEKLQYKYKCLEEENIKFKLNSDVETCEKVSCSELELAKKNSDLTRQKSQLSYHIFMLANENKTYWDTISRLNEEKQVFSSQIRELNSQLEKLESERVENDKLTINKDNEFSQTSLQHSISQPELQVEAAESMQSIETVVDVNLTSRENASDLGLFVGLTEMTEKLNEDKLLLQEQQDRLKKALDNLKKIFLGVMQMQEMKTDKNQATVEVLEQKKNIEQLISSTEKIVATCTEEEETETKTTNNVLMCPFCNSVLYNDDVCEEYHKHFLNHVQDCSDNESVLKSFEIV